MRLTRPRTALQSTVRHPLVVAAVALVCLSGWCMAGAAMASVPHATASTHEHHASHAQERVGADPHGGHAAHCAESACCRAVAKEAPRELAAPAIRQAEPVATEGTGRAGRPSAAPAWRDDGGAPPGFVAPLTC